jgi:hypothetical protein
MLFEYRTAWPFLKKDGLFLSHDIARNSAFFDFATEVGKRWDDWRVYEVLGGFRIGSPRVSSAGCGSSHSDRRRRHAW